MGALGKKSATAAAIAVLAALTTSSAVAQVETVVVTARKTAENIQKIPVAVTAISMEQIEQANMRTPQDIKFLTPGLQANQSAYDNQNVVFKIRGMSQAVAVLESSVGVYVDGVYQPMIFGLNSTLFDLERIEVAKGPQGTLYGKNTTAGVVNIITRKPELDDFNGYLSGDVGLYAAGGVDGSSQLVEGVVNLPIVTDELAARVDLAYDHSDGWGVSGLGSGSERKLNTRNDVYARGQLLYEPRSDLRFLVSANYAALNSTGAPVVIARVLPGSLAATDLAFERGITQAQAVDLMAQDAQGGNFYSTHGTDFAPYVTRSLGMSLTTDWDISQDVQLKSVSAYSNLQRRSGSDYDGTPFDIVTPNTGSRHNFWSQELNLSGKSFDDQLEWIGGAFYSEYNLMDGANPEMQGYHVLPLFTGFVRLFPNHREEVRSLGVFTHLTYHATDALTLSGGVRWSRDGTHFYDSDAVYDPTFTVVVACNAAAYGAVPPTCFADIGARAFSAVSYDLAANYQVTDDVMAYVTTRRGYRAGGWNFSGLIRPFQPEFATDYEVGLKSEWWDHKLLFNIDAYYTDYKGVQRTVVVLLPGGATGISTTNAASASIEGLEAELRVQPTDDFELGATYAYTDPQYKEFKEEVGPGVFVDLSNDAWEVAKHVVTLYGMYTWNLPSGDTLTYRGDWLYQSDLVLAANADLPENEQFYRQPAYGLANARVTYNFVDANAEIALYARNLFNKKYVTTATVFDSSLGYGIKFPGEPRFVGIQLTKHFGAN